MALGADDVQAADGDDAVVLGVGLRFEAVVQLLVDGAGRKHLGRDVLVEAGGLLDDHLVVALLLHRAAGEVFRVAAQQNIGAAAGHVRGDGDGAVVARLPSRGTWR